ncbi:hypothetical protein CPB84DRAFT_1671620, partial [Gymnopilus junonius]
TGRTGVLAKHPDIVDEIKKTLKDLRTSGFIVNVPLGHSIMLGVIRKHDASLLTNFKCSERYVHSFFESSMKWSPRTATRAAAHIPPNATEVCT